MTDNWVLLDLHGKYVRMVYFISGLSIIAGILEISARVSGAPMVTVIRGEKPFLVRYRKCPVYAETFPRVLFDIFPQRQLQ